MSKELNESWARREVEIGKAWGVTIKGIRDKHKAEVEQLKAKLKTVTAERDNIKTKYFILMEKIKEALEV